MATQTLPPVRMPQLSGGRERAQRLVKDLAGHMQGKTVHLDCTQLVAGTASFADELIKLVLEDGRAAQLIVEHASSDFRQYVYDAASDHGVAQRLDFIG